MRACVRCGHRPESGDAWEPHWCEPSSAERRAAANRMLAELYAVSAYRCRWCKCAARHPHEDWCGRCEIPDRERARYARRIAYRLGKTTEDVLALWDGDRP